MLSGTKVALITDAGTPVISDPGEVLVKAAKEAGIPVTSLPGPCALITALTLSGLPARRFVFEGFLPMEGKDRRQVLEELKEERRTVILYEALAAYADTEPRGEYVLVVEGKTDEMVSQEQAAKWESRTPQEHLADYMAQGLSKRRP